MGGFSADAFQAEEAKVPANQLDEFYPRWIAPRFKYTFHCEDAEIDFTKDYDGHSWRESILSLEIDGKSRKDLLKNAVFKKNEISMEIPFEPGRRRLSMGFGSGDNGSSSCWEHQYYFVGTAQIRIEVLGADGKRVTKPVPVALTLGGTGGFTVQENTLSGIATFSNLKVDHYLGWFANVEWGSNFGSEFISEAKPGGLYTVKLRKMGKPTPGCESIDDAMKVECWKKSPGAQPKLVPHSEN